MRLFLILSLIWIGQTASALCSGPSFFDRLSDAQLADLEQISKETAYGEGLLWRAQRDDKEIIVIGTMHIHDPRLVPIFERIKDEISSADVVLVEATDKEEAAILETISADPDMIFITDGPTLPERLDPEVWDALVEASRSRNVPPFLAAKMQPWYLSLTLSIPPCAMGQLITGQRGLDHMIMDEATSNSVPLVALEPYTTLLDAMRVGTFEEQVDALQLALLAPDVHSEMFVAMLDAYFAEEIAKVWEASRLASALVPGLAPEEGAALFAETEQILLIDRNRNWMPVIAANLHPKTVVAAGAAHLMGEDGILRLLEKDGWAISPY